MGIGIEKGGIRTGERYEHKSKTKRGSGRSAGGSLLNSRRISGLFSAYICIGCRIAGQNALDGIALCTYGRTCFGRMQGGKKAGGCRAGIKKGADCQTAFIFSGDFYRYGGDFYPRSFAVRSEQGGPVKL